MEIPKNRWDYRLVRNIWGEPSENLCPYFWQLMFSIGYLLATLGAFGAYLWFGYKKAQTTGSVIPIVYGAMTGLIFSAFLLLVGMKNAGEDTWMRERWGQVASYFHDWKFKLCTEYGEDWSPPDAWHGRFYSKFAYQTPDTKCDYVLGIITFALMLLSIPVVFIALPIWGVLSGELIIGFAFWILIGALVVVSIGTEFVQRLRGKVSEDNIFIARFKAAKNKVCPRLNFVDEEDANDG